MNIEHFDYSATQRSSGSCILSVVVEDSLKPVTLRQIAPLPSAWVFAERYLLSARQMPPLPSAGLSAKTALDKDFFAERRALGKGRHSTKNVFAKSQALGKGSHLAKNVFA